jgi:uroporphyrin-3 C-methyltransferase
MDENANTDDHLTTHADKNTVPEGKPPSSHWGKIVGVALLTISVSCLSVMLYRDWQTTPPMSTLDKSSQKVLEHIQNQIQALQQSQQQMTTQTQTSQQQIQQLLAQKPKQMQNLGTDTARYYLELAQMNAQWTHDLPTTLHLLELASQHLTQTDDSNSVAMRDSIEQDRHALQQIPVIDTALLLTKLNTLSQQVEQLSPRIYPSSAISPMHSNSNSITSWRENLQDNLQQLRGLVSIRHQEDTDLPIFGPNYYGLLRENIRLNLQQAQMGIVAQNQSLYHFALQATSQNIRAGFNPVNPKTRTILQALQELQNAKVAYPSVTLHSYSQFVESQADTAIDTKVSS